jgi:hypothetical protein
MVESYQFENPRILPYTNANPCEPKYQPTDNQTPACKLATNSKRKKLQTIRTCHSSNPNPNPQTCCLQYARLTSDSYPPR